MSQKAPLHSNPNSMSDPERADTMDINKLRQNICENIIKLKEVHNLLKDQIEYATTQKDIHSMFIKSENGFIPGLIIDDNTTSTPLFTTIEDVDNKYRCEYHNCKYHGHGHLQCPHCKNAYYCSNICQTLHWKSHERFCKEDVKKISMYNDFISRDYNCGNCHKNHKAPPAGLSYHDVGINDTEIRKVNINGTTYLPDWEDIKTGVAYCSDCIPDLYEHRYDNWKLAQEYWKSLQEKYPNNDKKICEALINCFAKNYS